MGLDENMYWVQKAIDDISSAVIKAIEISQMEQSSMLDKADKCDGCDKAGCSTCTRNWLFKDNYSAE